MKSCVWFEIQIKTNLVKIFDTFYLLQEGIVFLIEFSSKKKCKYFCLLAFHNGVKLFLKKKPRKHRCMQVKISSYTLNRKNCYLLFYFCYHIFLSVLDLIKLKKHFVSNIVLTVVIR